MVALPALSAVTTPPVAMPATAVLLLLHVPPPTDAVKDALPPVHKADGPLMIPAVALTVMIVTATQPDPVLKVIVDVPGNSPETMPSVPTAATVVLLLAHVPPVIEADSDKLPPAHTDVEPVMAGAALTVIVLNALHPPALYVMTATPTPAAVTTPVDAPMLTTEGSPDVHVPPDVALDNAEISPGHKTEGPETAPGTARTFSRKVLKQDVPSA